MKKVVLMCLLFAFGNSLFAQNNGNRKFTSVAAIKKNQAVANEDIAPLNTEVKKPGYPVAPTKRNQLARTIASDRVDLTTVQEVILGSSGNPYSVANVTANPISVDQDLGAVLFIHRGNAGVAGQSGNMLVYDYTLDGGTTWSVNQGPVIPASGLNRHPQGHIYNPPGNTDPANVRVVAMSAVTDGTNWVEVNVGSSKLDGSGQHLYTIPNNGPLSAIPASFCQRIPGEYWATGDSTVGKADADGVVALYKGVYSTSGDSVAWITTHVIDFKSIMEPIFVTSSGDLYQTSYNSVLVAFDPTGQHGWIATLGDLQGDSPMPDSTLYPIFWHSTDGGTTWTGPTAVRLSDFPDIVSSPYVYGYKPTTGFDYELAVDVNGNPHLFTVVGPYVGDGTADAAYGINPTEGPDINNQKSIPLGLYDITFDGTDWQALMLDTVHMFRGRPFTNPDASTFGYDNRNSISMTPDGTKLFFVWSDTDPANQQHPSRNNNPDVFLKGYDVTSGTVTPTYNATSQTSLGASAYFPTVSRIALRKDATTTSVPVITALPSDLNNDRAYADYYYLSGLDITDADFTIPAVGKNTNYANKVFSVSQNYPNPFKGESFFTLTLQKSANVQVTVSNLLGQQVKQVVTERLAEGAHQIKLSSEGLTSGVYLYTVTADGFKVTRKLVVE